MIEQAIPLIYLLSAVGFIFSLKWMNDPKTARNGVFAGVAAMVLAVAGTLLHSEMKSYEWILVAMVLGTAVGIPLSWVPLTAVPQRTALSHAFGGLAAGLVGTAKYFLWAGTRELTTFRMVAIAFEVILGYLTCTGSLMAAGKLQEVLPTRPITYGGQNVVNLGLLVLAVAIGAYLVYDPTRVWLFPILIALALAFGVLLVIPIGGADMPTVISLLNSYAGLAAVAMGFVLENKPAHHRRRARRLVGSDSLDHHVPGDEPVVHQRALRRLRSGTGERGGRRTEDGQERDRGGRRADPRERELGRRHSRLRHGRRTGTAPRARPVRSPEQEGDRRQVRDSPGRGPDARAHERAARRGRDSVRPPRGDGRHQPRDGPGRRRPGRGRQRRRQSRRSPRQEQPDLRHADHRRRPCQDRARHQANA